MNAPKVDFNIQNLSYSAATPTRGIHYVMGVTEMGPFAKPEQLISSWAQFQRVFGGYIAGSDFPLLCKQALDRGAILRVSRVGHYSDITDATTLDAVKAEQVNQVKLTFSDALVASNQVDIEVNSEAITPVVFTTDNDTTLTAVASALAGLDGVQAAYVIPITGSVGTLNREIVLITTTAADPVIVANVTLGASQPTISSAAVTSIANGSGLELFGLTPKYEGAAYNSLYAKVELQYGDYFRLIIGITGRTETETYQGLVTQNVASPTFLSQIAEKSQLVDVSYVDLSAETTIHVPKAGTYYFGNGTDGTTPVASDYVGDAGAKNGFYAFDAYDDALDISAPEKSDSTIHQAGDAYVTLRKDIRYLAHLSNSNLTAASYIAERDALNIDNYLVEFYAGGLKVTDPLTSAVKEISELGAVIGAMSYSDRVTNESVSCANIERGKILNVVGVVNNYGAPASYVDLNSMAQRGINMVVNTNNTVYVNSMFSAANANSKLSFGNIVKFLLYLQKQLKPTLRRYLGNPNDFPQWKRLFLEVQPMLDQMSKGEWRALYAYDWQGDQFITDISQMTVNVPADVDQGKYKVRLFLKTVSPMVEITVDLVITPTNFEFEIN